MTDATELRASVSEYRDPGTTADRRARIAAGWQAGGIPNQFAAMLRAAALDRR
jgi:hypothetical protein